jgi:hypothetical protein
VGGAMINIILNYGQLCNKILTLSHCIASALEYQFDLTDFSFYKYADYFELNYQSSRPRIHIIKNKNICVPVNLMSRMSSYAHLDHFYRTINKSNVGKQQLEVLLNSGELNRHSYFLQSWNYRDDDSFKKHIQEIRLFFQPKEQYYKVSKECVANVKKSTNCDLLIGVHIRRGDYREWDHGKHYFTDNQYAKWMCDLKADADSRDLKVAFLLCSNEPITFDEYDLHHLPAAVGSGNFIEDLYSLSLCDCIMGPPSTYSIWAALYGHKKLYLIQGADDELNINKFHYHKPFNEAES